MAIITMLHKNCTRTNSPEALPSSYQILVHIPLTALYFIIILTAIILNSTVLNFFVTGRIKRSPFTILLMNLTIADLVSAVGFTPFIAVKPTSLRNVPQTSADFLCTITEGQVLFWIPNTASMFTVMIISVNRYIMICKPVHSLAFYVKRHEVSYTCATIIWLLATTLNIPNFISRQFVPCAAYCKRVWPKDFSSRGYSMSIIMLGFLLPLFLMCFCFFNALRSLKKQESLIDNNPSVRQSRIHALRILGFLIFALVLCWLPFTVYWIMAQVLPAFPDGIKGHYVEMKLVYIALLFGMMNPVINPLVYGFRLSKEQRNQEKVLKPGQKTSIAVPLQNICVISSQSKDAEMSVYPKH